MPYPEALAVPSTLDDLVGQPASQHRGYFREAKRTRSTCRTLAHAGGVARDVCAREGMGISNDKARLRGIGDLVGLPSARPTWLREHPPRTGQAHAHVPRTPQVAKRIAACSMCHTVGQAAAGTQRLRPSMRPARDEVEADMRRSGPPSIDSADVRLGGSYMTLPNGQPLLKRLF